MTATAKEHALLYVQMDANAEFAFSDDASVASDHCDDPWDAELQAAVLDQATPASDLEHDRRYIPGMQSHPSADGGQDQADSLPESRDDGNSLPAAGFAESQQSSPASSSASSDRSREAAATARHSCGPDHVHHQARGPPCSSSSPPSPHSPDQLHHRQYHTAPSSAPHHEPGGLGLSDGGGLHPHHHQQWCQASPTAAWAAAPSGPPPDAWSPGEARHPYVRIAAVPRVGSAAGPGCELGAVTVGWVVDGGGGSGSAGTGVRRSLSSSLAAAVDGQQQQQGEPGPGFESLGVGRGVPQTAAAWNPTAQWQSAGGMGTQSARAAGPSAGHPPAGKEGGGGAVRVRVRNDGVVKEDEEGRPERQGPVGPPTPAEAREQQRLWQQYQRRYQQQRQDQQQNEGRMEQRGQDGLSTRGVAGSGAAGPPHQQHQLRPPYMNAAPSWSSSKGAYSPAAMAAAAATYPSTPSATPNRSYRSASGSPGETGVRQQPGHAQPPTVGEAEHVGCAARRQTQDLISMADRLIGTWRGRCVAMRCWDGSESEM